MPRYLTPAKTCLLVLVDLYTSSDEIPLGSKLDLLDFILTQINAPSNHDDERKLESKFQLLSDCELNHLSAALSKWQLAAPGRSIYDLLLQRLWELRDLDSLHSLFQHLNSLVAP